MDATGSMNTLLQTIKNKITETFKGVNDLIIDKMKQFHI